MEDLIVVEESCKASVDDLGRHGAVGTNVGQQEAGAKMRILLPDFCASLEGLVILVLSQCKTTSAYEEPRSSGNDCTNINLITYQFISR